jgi:hypothetical protein
MHRRFLFALASAAALAGAPRPAAADVSPNSGWSLTLSVWGGVSRYDILGLEHNVGGVDRQYGRDLMNGDFNAYGGSGVLRLGWLDVGVLYEGALIESRTDSAVLTPVAGIAFNITDKLRLDLLGELGGHRVTNIGVSEFDASDAKTTWLPFVGVRPSLSFRLPFGPTRFILSATPFARWDLVQKDITVTGLDGAGGETRQTYEVGGSTFGVVGGVGLEI